MDEGDEEWGIYRVENSLIVLRIPRFITHVDINQLPLALIARGFKTNQEALFYLPLYSEE